jgi:SAM-dependent methyltransferase
LLNIKKGENVLDLGCGHGSFGIYAQKKGIKVTGITISDEQAKDCRKKGLETIVWDYTVFNPDFCNKFDYINILGSSEHLFSGTPFSDKTYKNKKEKMCEMFKMLNSYFKPGQQRKLFYSGLHINPKYRNSLGHLILDRTYGGTLQLDCDGYDVFSSADCAGLKTIHKEDITKHYYMATVLDNKHFGNPNIPYGKASIGLFILGFIYPFAWYMLYYGIYGYWMWMFDGNTHTFKNPNYTIKNREDRPVTCWWGIFELNN